MENDKENAVTIKKSIYDALIAKDFISVLRGFIWRELELAKLYSTRKLQI